MNKDISKHPREDFVWVGRLREPVACAECGGVIPPTHVCWELRDEPEQGFVCWGCCAKHKESLRCRLARVLPVALRWFGFTCGILATCAIMLHVVGWWGVAFVFAVVAMVLCLPGEESKR